MVLMIVGILATIGASVYLGMRDEGQVTAAELNVREALGAVHGYHQENESYTGMTRATLSAIDAGIRLSREPIVSGDGTRYCVESTHNGRSPTAPTEPGISPHSVQGPGGQVSPGPCPASL